MAKISNNKMKTLGLHDAWVLDHPDYMIGDIVTEGGKIYICTVDHIPVIGDNASGSPTQSLQTSWIENSSATIEQGGVAWSSTTTYNVGDIVTQGTETWIALTSTINISPITGTSDANWYLNTVVTTSEHDATETYATSQIMFMTDPDRSTYVTIYRNDTGLEIAPEAFDPLKWTQISSGYQTAYGLEHTQTGLLTGSILKGTTGVDLTDGTGIIVDQSNPDAPVTTKVSWVAQTIAIPVIAQEINWITVDINGLVTLTNSEPSINFYNDRIMLGETITDDLGVLDVVNFQPITTNSLAKSVIGLHKYFTPPGFVSGGILSGIATTMNIELDPGNLYGYNINYKNDTSNPHEVITVGTSPMTFVYIDQNSVNISTAQIVDPDTWDNAGVQSTLGIGKASIQLVYYNFLNDNYYVVQGQKEYKDYQDAINNRGNYAAATTKPNILKVGSVFLGYIIGEQGTTDLEGLNAIVITAGGTQAGSTGGTITELNNLTDVTIASPADGEILTYNSTTALWENQVTSMQEYTVGVDYRVNQYFTQLGTIYKVLTAFTSVTQLDDTKVQPMNLGSGNACFQSVNIPWASTWIKVCRIDTYTAGTITIGGFFNGKQIQFSARFLTNYQSSQWDMQLSQHTVGIVNQVLLTQPNPGDPVEVWINVVASTAPTANWDMHVVVNASGGKYKAVQFQGSTPIGVGTAPGGVSGHFHDWNPNTTYKDQRTYTGSHT